MADLSGYELTHKKILDSGKTNFLNDGYERANLRKICKDAGVREYHYVFCAVMACKVLRLLCGRIFFARLPCKEVSWRILRTAKAQKESVRFAL